MFHIALRIITYDKVRSLLTLLGVIFAVTLIFSQIGIYLGLMEASSVLIDNTPGDIWVSSKNSRNFDFAQPIPEYLYYQVLATSGVQWAEKLVVAWHIIKQKDGGREQIEIVGFNPDTGVGGPWNLRSGDIHMLKNGNFFIVDASAMKRLGSIEVGEYRDIGSRRLQLVGISEGIRSFTTAPFIFTSYGLAQRIVEYVGQDSTVFIIAKVRPEHRVQEVVEAMRQRFPGVDVYSKADFSYKTRMYWTIETGVGFAFLLTIVVSFFVGMLIVGQTIYNSTVEHLKEYGTMKALGAENLDIYQIIFAQAILNALVGYVVSLVIALISVRLYDLTGMTMVVTWQVALMMLALTLVMCLLAAVISIRKIKTIDPAILFRG